MKQEVTKEVFLKLLSALEKDRITLEQFHILSNHEPFYDCDIMTIVDILMLSGIRNQEELFQKLLGRDDLEAIYHTFQASPIYLTDLKRQKFMFEHYSNLSEKAMRFLEDDAFFQDEDFRMQIVELGETYFSVEVLEVFLEYLEEHQSTLNVDLVKRSIKKLSQLTNRRAISDFTKCMMLESLQKNPVWYDRLIEFYNRHAYMSFNCAYGFRKLEKKQKMDVVNERVKCLIQREKRKEQLEESFASFFQKLPNIIMQEERKELLEEPYFSYLIDSSFNKKTNIPDTKALIISLINRGFSSDKIFSICDKIAEIPMPVVCQITSRAFASGLLTEDCLEMLQNMKYNEAYSFIVQKALYLGNEQYIEEGKKYFGETFSPVFCQYIDEPSLTKEELLAMKDKIEVGKSTFNGKTFTIDTTSLIPKSFQEHLESPEELQKDEGKLPKKKSLFSRFKKGN